MKKKLCGGIALSILICILLSGCTSRTLIESRLNSLNTSNDHEYTDERFEVILQAVKEKDRSKIKELFSIVAIEETEDMEAGIDYLFNMLQGDIVSWKRGGQNVNERCVYGGNTKEIITFYTIETEQNTYSVFMLDYRKDPENPDNIGLYTFRIGIEENEEKEFGYWQDNVIPGIYFPEE